jgi:hypothetical protein
MTAVRGFEVGKSIYHQQRPAPLASIGQGMSLFRLDSSANRGARAVACV